MTYCCALQVDEGIVFASDTRTNAGPDHIAVVRKMSLWERPGDRVIVMLVSGNLAITQKTVNLLNERLVSSGLLNLWSVTTMFNAAQLVGDTVREVYRADGEALRAFGYDFTLSVILGGQIAGEPPRLFNVYAAGNFVEATRETPYVQIGEVKYGKPIIDRVVTCNTPIAKAAKCALVSFASTLRSNVTVGMPIDLLVYRSDTLRVDEQRRYQENDAYFRSLSDGYGEGIIRVFDSLPDPN
ncbi:MAG: peptidase [Proteobacteria bacterium]|nr:peptidase [Burkholderiales bacterium]